MGFFRHLIVSFFIALAALVICLIHFRFYNYAAKKKSTMIAVSG